MKLHIDKVVVLSRFIITGIYDDQLNLAPQWRTLRDDGQEGVLYKGKSFTFLFTSRCCWVERYRLQNHLTFPDFCVPISATFSSRVLLETGTALLHRGNRMAPSSFTSVLACSYNLFCLEWNTFQGISSLRCSHRVSFLLIPSCSFHSSLNKPLAHLSPLQTHLPSKGWDLHFYLNNNLSN